MIDDHGAAEPVGQSSRCSGYFYDNNFVANSFDISTNSRQNFNTFEKNYWAEYDGYDLNKDGFGDIPFRPVTMFSMMIESHPTSLVLLHSLFIDILNIAESIIPAITPEALTFKSKNEDGKLITVKNLVKNFGKNRVLKNIDLTIDAGKVTAIVGPNGSGKTTLIKTILGLVRPTDGIIEVDGKTIKDDYLYRNKIGYMPQIARYPENLTGNEIISLIKSIRNSDEFSDKEILSSLKLEPEMEKPFKNLSGGYLSSGYKDAVALILLLLVLFFKPEGLLGSREAANLKRF